MARVKVKKPKKTRGAKKARKATTTQRRNQTSKSGKRKGEKKPSPGAPTEYERQDNLVDELIGQMQT